MKKGMLIILKVKFVFDEYIYNMFSISGSFDYYFNKLFNKLCYIVSDYINFWMQGFKNLQS